MHLVKNCSLSAVGRDRHERQFYCRGKWLMADLGLTFADADYPVSTFILPDLNSSRSG
jgi:ribonuclease J